MNVLLTGASKGLGLRLTEVLLEKGEVVYAISRSRSENLSRLLSLYPKNLKWLQYDLADVEKIKQTVFKEWIGSNTPIHGFVNNAAVAYDDIVTNLNLDSLENMYRINVFSPMMLTKLVVRQMLLHNVKGSLIHLSSISAHTGYKGLSMYASTKGALESFSKNIAREWGEKGIRSNTVVAGFMKTEMSSSLSEEKKDRIYKRTSLKQPVSIESVAETICFLLSEQSNSITGQNIHVDNGTI